MKNKPIDKQEWKNLLNHYAKVKDVHLREFFTDTNRSNDFSFTDTGINYFEFIIHPTSIIKLPLEILFKTIHSNEKMPLIKFNQGEGYENIYRIYTDDYISLSGIKIPYLYVKHNFKKRC